MEQVYTSKVDTWLAVVLVGSALACVVAFVLVLRTGRIGVIATTAVAVVLGAGLPLWLMLGTTYTLTDSALVIRSGPFAWHVPVDQITGVSPTRNPLSSPALSLDRLKIDYGRGRSIMISPKDSDAFLRDLQARRGVGD